MVSQNCRYISSEYSLKHSNSINVFNKSSFLNILRKIITHYDLNRFNSMQPYDWIHLLRMSYVIGFEQRYYVNVK